MHNFITAPIFHHFLNKFEQILPFFYERFHDLINGNWEKKQLLTLHWNTVRLRVKFDVVYSWLDNVVIRQTLGFFWQFDCSAHILTRNSNKLFYTKRIVCCMQTKTTYIFWEFWTSCTALFWFYNRLMFCLMLCCFSFIATGIPMKFCYHCQHIWKEFFPYVLSGFR